jgi:hypothetical protein
MQTSQEALYNSPSTCLPWPSALPTQDCPYGPIPFVDHPVHGLPSNVTQASGLVYIAPQTAVAETAPNTHTPRQNEVRDPPKLLPRLAEDSNPIIVSSSDSGRKVADLLKRKKIKWATKIISQQAQLLADLLGGDLATWRLAPITVSGSGNAQSNQCSGSWKTIQIQTRVLYVDFVQSQQVCFKLTAGTVEALIKHHRNVCCDNVKAYSYANMATEIGVKALMESFELAIEGFVFWTETNCLEKMKEDGSGELTTHHSTQVELAILKLLEPTQHHDNRLPKLAPGLNHIMPQPIGFKSSYHSYSEYSPYSNSWSPVHEPGHDLPFY